MAVELYGPKHENKMDEDERRDKILNQLGIRVLRIKNEELNDIESVLKKINSMLINETPPFLARKGARG